MSKIPDKLYDIRLHTLQGDIFDWESCFGKKVLIVNTASACGFTKQYKELQELYEQFGSNLQIIGTPCNQFGGQEPGDAKEIEEFCELNFGVSFPLSEKLDVKGDQQHPLYTWLTRKKYNGVKNSTVKWNFQKYLLDEDGNLIDYYFSITRPMSKRILKYLV